MSKTAIKIELDEKEDAIIYAEKTLGRNKTIRKRYIMQHREQKVYEN